KQTGYLHHPSPVQYVEPSGRRGPVRPAIKGPLRVFRVEFDEVVTSLQIDPHVVTLVDNCHVGVQVGPRRRVEGGLERMGGDSYQPLTQIIGCPDVVAVPVGTQTAWKDLSDPERCIPREIIRCEVAGFQKRIGIWGYRNLERLASDDVAMSDDLTFQSQAPIG